MTPEPWCNYPDDDTGKRCRRATTWVVQRMPTSWTGEHKFVYVCDRHAALWRKQIPYCYMESIATAEPYAGQECRTAYEREYERTTTIRSELEGATK